MAETVLTVQQIIEKLNVGKDSKPWDVVPGIFSLSGAKIEGDTVTVKNESLVVKCFINQETGEIKNYLSKITDEPETLNLPI